jgi:aspartyl/glutamyl-tRNA(Asn/Gln) amidotransferase C subunit
MTKDQIIRLVSLARLNLPKTTEEKFLGWLSETLDFVKVLDGIDTSNVTPTAQVSGLENIFRQDFVRSYSDLKLSGTFIKTSKVVNKN